MSDETSAGEWCTVESDPGVFTEMLEKIGCKGIELDELWSLDDDSLANLCSNTKVYGLIFLFKWMGSEKHKEHAESKTKETDSGGGDDEDGDDANSNVWFAHQTVTNACATQAILSILLNADLAADEIGTTLSDLKSFTVSFPPELKGVAIGSSEGIRQAHNSFSRQDAFLQEGKLHIPSDSDEAFHFVAYVPRNETVYELDGLQKGPIAVGRFTAATDDNNTSSPGVESWLTTARQAIQERMIAGGDHVKFNLMAVIQDKRISLQQKLSTQEDNADIMAHLAAEDAKREQWKLENQRRRHNYVPLCVQLLKELAKKGTLPNLVSEAKERQVAKRQKMNGAKK